MKKIFKIFLCVLSLSFLFYVPSVEAKTLQDLKNELATTRANQAAIEAQRKAAKAKVQEYNNEIVSAGANIDKAEADIQASREKIDELEIEIDEKNEQIKELLRFLQVSGGDNEYLEYMFGASDFTDFIYRSAVVEQMSEYNDQLIDEMYDMIEENKKLQKELEVKIVDLKEEIKVFQSKLSSLNLTLYDLDDEQQDVADEIKIAQAEIEYYERNGCELHEDISDCVDIPYSNGFTRPTNSGYMSSNYGYRSIWGGTSFHRGVDIATPEWTKVYASAPGQVYVVSKVPSGRTRCGGNMLYIKHNVDGKKFTTVYMHLIGFNVSEDEFVTANTVVGYSGGGAGTSSWETCSTGAHLHFGIYQGWTTSKYNSVDPRDYINFPAKYSRYYTRW